ncbi:MAG: cytochrome b/b6 domain-containing protein [Candidatus Thiodiazotropha endolucinida]|nr:cytochrome b/b6 domain-containing protein [Candidatus Thiodiazotropha endolucinida]
MLYFFMLLVAVSGLFLLKAISMIGGLSLNDLHYLSYQVIATFTLLHIIAVFSHDLAGKGSDISGMINGQRTFEIDNPRHDDSNRTQSIALGELMKSLNR